MADEDWFAPKMFGLGAGLPIAWQGWAVLGAFIAAVAGVGVLLLPQHRALFIGIVVILLAGFSVVAAQHTRGGWHWRWGSDD